MSSLWSYLSRPRLLLVLFLVAFLVPLGVVWIDQPCSNKELLANLSKAFDYLDGFRSVGNWPWWTPFYEMGHSMADYLGTIFTYLLLLLGNWLIPSPLGWCTGPKIIGLLMAAASSIAMYGFVEALSKCKWCALVAAMLYVASPQLSLKLTSSEHIVVAFCFLYPPLILWNLLRLTETGKFRYGAGLGIFVAAMALTYVRTAVVFIPVIACFALWLWINRPQQRSFLFRGVVQGILFFIPLGLFPLLPLMREKAFVALFDFDPLAGWQASFSMKTLLSWFDRGSEILGSMPPTFTVDEGGFYLGLVPILLVGFLTFYRWKETAWSKTSQGRLFSFFTALALGLTWLSMGPRFVLKGHLEFLQNAQHVTDWVIPAVWLILALPIWLIYVLIPNVRFRNIFFVLLVLIYFLIPGFQILEKLPLFHPIRAPWFFWEVGGTFCVAVAAGLSISFLKEQINSHFFKVLVALLLLSIGLLDLAPYYSHFARGGLSTSTWKDFEAVQTFLKNQPQAGRVNFVSGRYFYLLTPRESGRGLMTEAFHSHFMLRWTRESMQAGITTNDLQIVQWSLAGVTYVVLDKEDPDTPLALQETIRQMLPVCFENDHFTVLYNSFSLAPFFSGTHFIALQCPYPPVAATLLGFVKSNYLTLETSGFDPNWPAFAGVAAENGSINLKPEVNRQKGASFEVYQKKLPRTNHHQFTIWDPPKKGGFIVIPESYHPDWTCTINGIRVPIYRAFGYLLCAYAPPESSHIEFQFRPPVWYSVLLSLSAVGWVLIVGGFFLFLPGWFKKPSSELPIAEATDPSHEIKQALVVIPTYNELSCIVDLLDKILGVDTRLAVLVVDDASPDGTAELVRKHSLFGKRVHLLERKSKLGYASACRQGFLWGLSHQYDAVIEMDADHSHDPYDIPQLLTMLQVKADLAIGSRYLDGVRVYNWPLTRLLLSVGAGWYVRLLTGLPLTDPTSGFKAFNRHALKSLPWKQLTSEGYGFNIETHYFAWQNKLRIVEIPIVFTERDRGASKMTLTIMCEAAFKVLRLGFHHCFVWKRDK